jgi:hypothetical protein
VSPPDFEIKASIRAKRLVARVPPNAQTRAEREEEVTLTRHEQRSGVPETMEAGEPYSDVVIDKRIVGEIQEGQATCDETGRDGPVARETRDGQQHPQGRR